MSVETQNGRAPGGSVPPQDPGGLEGQLHALYAERARLVAELGTADADELIALVADLRADGFDVPADASGAEAPLDPSLVMQVEALYAEKDQLHQELGVSSAEEVIAHVRELGGRAPASTTTTETTTSESTTTETSADGTKTETTAESRTFTHTRTTT